MARITCKPLLSGRGLHGLQGVFIQTLKKFIKKHFVRVNDCGKVAAAEHHLRHQITHKHNQSGFKSGILRSALFKL